EDWWRLRKELGPTRHRARGHRRGRDAGVSCDGSEEAREPPLKQAREPLATNTREPSVQTLTQQKRNAPGAFEMKAPGALKKKIRQRPTLPRGFPRSTIGSGGLNFRVRDGNGCDPSDIATGKLI